MRFTKTNLRRKGEEWYAMAEMEQIPPLFVVLGTAPLHRLLVLSFDLVETTAREKAAERAKREGCNATEAFNLSAPDFKDRILWWFAEQGIVAVEGRQLLKQFLAELLNISQPKGGEE